MLQRLFEHDLSAVAHGETGDARSNRRKSDGLEPMLRGNTQGMSRRRAQCACGRAAAKLHACGVNHIFCLELPARSERGSPDRDRTNLVAFALNFGSTFAANRSRNAATKIASTSISVRSPRIRMIFDNASGMAIPL